jgi:putative SOS response-associated peptidase YedK
MCGRYTLTRTNLGEVVKELHAELDASAEQLRLPRYNIGPAQTCAIALAGDDAPLLTAAVWGLRLGPRLVVNLRSETAGRRRDLQRCVIPADGFYEWTGEKGHKRPIWFHRPDGGLLFFAGLVDDAGTFAIVTDPAAGPVLEIHDRSPVMFTAAKARTWLAKGGPPKGGAVELVSVEVSPRANSVKNDDAGLLDPVVDR